MVNLICNNDIRTIEINIGGFVRSYSACIKNGIKYLFTLIDELIWDYLDESKEVVKQLQELKNTIE